MVTVMWPASPLTRSVRIPISLRCEHGKDQTHDHRRHKAGDIRLSAVIKKCDRYFNQLLVHTGQNYDYTLNQIFFEDLELRAPDFYLTPWAVIWERPSATSLPRAMR